MASKCVAIVHAETGEIAFTSQGTPHQVENAIAPDGHVKIEHKHDPLNPIRAHHHRYNHATGKFERLPPKSSRALTE